VRTESGNGTIELRFTPTEVTGSIVDGRQHWRLAGRRTS
jgi:hypothetical protein